MDLCAGYAAASVPMSFHSDSSEVAIVVKCLPGLRVDLVTIKLFFLVRKIYCQKDCMFPILMKASLLAVYSCE